MKKKVLTVDDSRTIRNMLLVTLNNAGFDIVQAEDGVEGLEVLEESNPDVIVTDINMPRLDGFGFHRRCTAERPLPGNSDLGLDHRKRRGKEEPRS
jgi:CheY-like chemotaxis protein